MLPYPASSERRALVFGARGQIGRFLLPRLQAAGVAVDAVSRTPPADAAPGVAWHRGELFAGPDLALAPDWIFSCGPLDGFVAWFGRSALRPARVVAFGSTSAASKHDSPDAQERALAARLAASEARLQELTAARGAHLTLLRPTLVYGAGRDRNLTRIARLAQKTGVFVLPRGATGKRQPVHVDDLAEAAWQCATSGVLSRVAYDLPGGETVAYCDMVARVLACLDRPPKLIEVPSSPLRAALWCAHRVGVLGDAGAGVWARLATDLVFDAQPAHRDFGYAPRRFEPRATMFDPDRAKLHRTM